jgi:MFS family permease
MIMARKYYNRNVIGMSLTSLFTDLSSESVYAVLPFYILSLGYGREIVGLIEGLGELTASLMKYASGFIAERLGRYKRLAVAGYSLSSLSKPFFALASNWPLIALVKITDRMGKGIRTSPRDTLLASSVDSEHRGRAFGLHRAMDTTGAVLGPLTAALLLPIVGFNGIFLLSIIPGLTAVLILALLVTDVAVGKRSREAGEARLPGVYWLFVSTIVFTGLSGYMQAFLLIRSSELGWSEEGAVYLLTMANIIYASLAFPVGYMSDVYRRLELYPLVFVLLSIGATALIFSTNMLSAIVFFTVFGIYMAFHDTLMRIMTSRLVKPFQRARAYGFMHGSYGLSALIGYYIVGLIYQYAGPSTAFMYTLVNGLIGLALSVILVSRIHTMR